MSSLNKVILIGNLGDEPEEFSNGVVKFSLATNENYKAKDGSLKGHTEWHSVVIFNDNLSKFVMKYFKKGSKAYVEGKISTSEYVTKDGTKKRKTDIIVSNRDSQIKSLSYNDSVSKEASVYNYKGETAGR